MHAEQIDDYDEIVRVLEMCMEGEARGDAGLLKEAFHEDARMYGQVAGARYDMAITDFFGLAESEPADTGKLSRSGVVSASGWRRRQRGGRRGGLLGHSLVH
jgi:hypothetical protein